MTQAEGLDVVVVTGVSGAGRSTALNALEDLGYYCVDNLPPPVVVSTLSALLENGSSKIALGVDVRVRAFLESAPAVIRQLHEDPGIELKVLYVDASEEHIARRYSATRRPHPLAQKGDRSSKSVREGIALEKQLLAPLRALASIVIDTTRYTVHDLRRQVLEGFAADGEKGQTMSVRVLSFGFKYGPPQDADLVFDVRFLPNPYFVEDLRPLSGQDQAVADYVLGDDDSQQFLGHLARMLEFCIPRFRKEGKSYVTIAIGCTGGRHRSVALCQKIATDLTDKLGFQVEAVHRDMRQAEHLTLTAGSGS